VSDGSRIAYWGSTGVYVIDPATNGRTQVSSVAYTSGANLDLSSGYLIYGNTLKNPANGATSTCPSGSKLSGDRLVCQE